MKLRSIHIYEATTKWMGQITAILGNDEPYTLNYGTGVPGRPPFLYVPVPLSIVRSLARKVSKQYGQKPSHVGEAHVTISMGPELDNIGPDELIAAGLFDNDGNGIQVNVQHTGKLKILKAAFYKDEADPEGPELIAEIVHVPEFATIRRRLGLSPYPSIPGVDKYLPHITVGYSANKNNIHRSYVDKYGSTPRHRQ